jgi:hypothetical protein
MENDRFIRIATFANQESDALKVRGIPGVFRIRRTYQ